MLQLNNRAKEQQQKYTGSFSPETLGVVSHQRSLSTTLISTSLKKKIFLRSPCEGTNNECCWVIFVTNKCLGSSWAVAKMIHVWRDPFGWMLVCRKSPIPQHRHKTNIPERKGRKGKAALPQSWPGVLALSQGSLTTLVQQDIFLETKILPCSAGSLSQDKE